MDNLITLQFGTAGAIRFADCASIVSLVPNVFCGWDITVCQPDQTVASACVTRTKHGWAWQSFGKYKPRDWDRIPPETEIRVITDVHEAVLHWYLAAHPETLCLHAGAAEIGGGLVCFPARGRAGKSTLIAQLAFLGHRIFGDDVLGYRNNLGVSLGLHPRLRLPLADSLKQDVKAFIRKNAGPAGHGWHYLKTGPDRMAQLEEPCSIGGIVLLRRSDSGAARLSTARTADALSSLISENIIRVRPMLEIFEIMYDLAKNQPKMWLDYSDPLQAAELLQREFS